MPDATPLITDSNQTDLDELLSTVAEIAESQRRVESTLAGLLAAFRAGGIKGLRSFASRPDPDGSRAQMLRDGLANLEDHRG